MGLYSVAALPFRDFFWGKDIGDMGDSISKWGIGFSPSTFMSFRADLTRRERCERVCPGPGVSSCPMLGTSLDRLVVDSDIMWLVENY